MNAALSGRPQRAGREFLRELHRRNRVLFVVALANLALAVLFTGLMQVDGRMLLGRNVWTKPWKFATSIAIFTATMAWILPSLSLAERIERLATYTVGAAMTVEIILISTQAARGVRSHFNQTTTLNTAIFAVMGLTITLSTASSGTSSGGSSETRRTSRPRTCGGSDSGCSCSSSPVSRDSS